LWCYNFPGESLSLWVFIITTHCALSLSFHQNKSNFFFVTYVSKWLQYGREVLTDHIYSPDNILFMAQSPLT